MGRFTLQRDGQNIARVQCRAKRAQRYEKQGFTVVPGWLNLNDGKSEEEKAADDTRRQRNQLLETWAWTVRLESPLAASNQQEWLTYLKALHRVTLGESWPEQPALVYAEPEPGGA